MSVAAVHTATRQQPAPTTSARPRLKVPTTGPCSRHQPGMRPGWHHGGRGSALLYRDSSGTKLHVRRDASAYEADRGKGALIVHFQDAVGHKAQVVRLTQEDLQKRLGDYGFLVKQFTLNEVRAPDSIVRAIEAKNTMAQEALRAQNELQKKQFEAQQRIIEAEGEAKAILTRAQSQAESNRLLSASLTAALVEYKRIERWNGQLPQVSGGATPFINLQK